MTRGVTIRISVLMILFSLSEPGMRQASASSQESLSCRGSEAVELYPGYPGYRGYIAGLVGYAELACLDDLEDADPSFSKSDVDRANRRAARSLGISGAPEDWTWENWMAIESERGLSVTCYQCLFAFPPPNPDLVQSSYERGDARLAMGTYSQGPKDFVRQHLQGESNSAALVDSSPTDHDLRAYAGMIADGDYLNAPETLELMGDVLDSLFEGGSHLDPQSLWDSMIDQGGYTPTPEDAHPQDQIYMVLQGASALTYLSPSSFFSVLQRAAQIWTDEVARNPRSAPSFVDFLIDEGLDDLL